MTNIPDRFETYHRRPEDQERCSFCARADDDLMVYDGHGYDPERLYEPGTDLLICLLCQGRAYRVLLWAENDPDCQTA